MEDKIPEAKPAEHHCDENCKHVSVRPINPDKPNDSGDHFSPEDVKKSKEASDTSGPTGVSDGGGGSGISGATGGTGGGRRFLRGSAAKFIRDPNRQVVCSEKTVGPNAKCPCGSGKKHKKCCMWK
jgi:hypothetical protein